VSVAEFERNGFDTNEVVLNMSMLITLRRYRLVTE